MATKREDRYEITRTTLHIPKPFETVLRRLQSSIATKSTNGMAITNDIDTREGFEASTNSFLGPHGFMQFATIQHGQWIQLYGIHPGKSLTRIVFGNPQVAITMLQHDVTAGLFAPVEALLVDLGEGNGTDVVYIVPSTLIAGATSCSLQLREAAEALDSKLEKLWRFVAEEDWCYDGA